MSDWLAELNAKRIYNYKRENDEAILSGTLAQFKQLTGVDVKGEHGEVIDLGKGETARYAGFEPIKLGQSGSVVFEKNGRKAYMQRDADGNISYISATKMHYLKTGKIENQYSDDFQEVITKQVQAEIRNSQAEQADKTLQNAIKHLGDGEYVSDGKNFIQADKYEEDIKSAKQKG